MTQPVIENLRKELEKKVDTGAKLADEIEEMRIRLAELHLAAQVARKEMQFVGIV